MLPFSCDPSLLSTSRGPPLAAGYTALPAGSSMLIPVPGTAGAVVVGESVITFISANAVRSTAIKPTLVKVWVQQRPECRLPSADLPTCMACVALALHAAGTGDGPAAPPRSLSCVWDGVTMPAPRLPALPHFVQAYGQVDADGSRFLLSDYLGNLSLLLLLREGDGGVSALKLEPLGRTPAAATLSYLDSGVVFVGSSFGDSQLIRCVTAAVARPRRWRRASRAGAPEAPAIRLLAVHARLCQHRAHAPLDSLRCCSAAAAARAWLRAVGTSTAANPLPPARPFAGCTATLRTPRSPTASSKWWTHSPTWAPSWTSASSIWSARGRGRWAEATAAVAHPLCWSSLHAAAITSPPP